MDILSTSLATLITSMSGNMTDSYVENVNSQLTPVVIEHQGHDIYFKHHLWKIRSNSVCQNKRHKITEFSQCTIAAKSAFNEVSDTPRPIGRGFLDRSQNLPASTRLP